jgi:hypothetical protein
MVCWCGATRSTNSHCPEHVGPHDIRGSLSARKLKEEKIGIPRARSLQFCDHVRRELVLSSQGFVSAHGNLNAICLFLCFLDHGFRMYPSHQTGDTIPQVKIRNVEGRGCLQVYSLYSKYGPVWTVCTEGTPVPDGSRALR